MSQEDTKKTEEKKGEKAAELSAEQLEQISGGPTAVEMPNALSRKTQG